MENTFDYHHGVLQWPAAASVSCLVAATKTATRFQVLNRRCGRRGVVDRVGRIDRVYRVDCVDCVDRVDRVDRVDFDHSSVGTVAIVVIVSKVDAPRWRLLLPPRLVPLLVPFLVAVFLYSSFFSL